MTNTKIEALRSAAVQKAHVTADRVDKALDRMIKQGQIISFQSVATAANVSTAYLYKQSDLRNRIETLRSQQKQKPKQSQPPASENSKSVIISTLREENKKLRAEIEGLRRINEGLTGRIYQLKGAEELAERFKASYALLKQQFDECCQQAQHTTLTINHLTVASLDKKKTELLNFTEQVKQLLEPLGIQLNSTLTKIIKSVSEQTVLDAIEALNEALTDGNIDKPAAWLKRAIEQGWKPNGKINIKSELELFTEWYPKAKNQKLIQASQTTENGIMIYTNNEKWVSFSQMLAQHPLETL